MMYTLETLQNDAGVVIRCQDREVCRLIGGLCDTILVTHTSLTNSDGRRAQDFLHGIALALVHCSLTGVEPISDDGLTPAGVLA